MARHQCSLHFEKKTTGETALKVPSNIKVTQGGTAFKGLNFITIGQLLFVKHFGIEFSIGVVVLIYVTSQIIILNIFVLQIVFCFLIPYEILSTKDINPTLI